MRGDFYSNFEDIVFLFVLQSELGVSWSLKGTRKEWRKPR